jgi:hypothetical protein
MHDQDRQAGTPFTFDAKTEAAGPRVGFALSGPLYANVGWMGEGSFSYLFGDITGTVGGLAVVRSLKVDRVKNAELRAGLVWDVWTASRLTIGWQAEFWSGRCPSSNTPDSALQPSQAAPTSASRAIRAVHLRALDGLTSARIYRGFTRGIPKPMPFLRTHA